LRFSNITPIVGPSGSKKTFTLDLLWYAITGKWASYQITDGRIAYLEMVTSRDVTSAKYHHGEWHYNSTPENIDVRLGNKTAGEKPNLPVIYLRDDRIAVHDTGFPVNVYPKIFEHDSIYHNTKNASGLLFDFATWAYNDNLNKEISSVIQMLFGSQYLGLAQGYTKLSLLDARAIPQLNTKNGRVSVPYLPYHMRRVLALVYSIFLIREERSSLKNFTDQKKEINDSPLLILVDGIHELGGIRLLESASLLSNIIGSPIQWVVTSRKRL
jgi:hypothetical protein